ncbi:MAG: TetR/AcrR family transcriptional regulator [Hyphomicrobiales bacterium]|nr:TetR/AcrR family transcriptional regulator [Hyphomicrobiales bacterium]MCP5374429.1 TetR/AcrR family transcriptional regulator [Hyphomicrobiales bacterium]
MTRRVEILRRATEVFSRQGVAQTSIEDIARAVGIKREGVYYYFSSREDILLEIILPQSRTLLFNFQNIAAGRAGVQERLHAAIRNHLESYNPGYLEMSVALREDHGLKKKNRGKEEARKMQELRRVWKDYTGLWMALVQEGQGTGQFDPALNPKMVAYGILGMCNWLSRWYHPDGDLTIGEIVETFFAMVSRGIALPAGEGEAGGEAGALALP